MEFGLYSSLQSRSIALSLLTDRERNIAHSGYPLLYIPLRLIGVHHHHCDVQKPWKSVEWDVPACRPKLER